MKNIIGIFMITQVPNLHEKTSLGLSKTIWEVFGTPCVQITVILKRILQISFGHILNRLITIHTKGLYKDIFR